MNRDDLVRVAASLLPIGPEALAEYRGRRQASVAELNQLMLAREDVDELVGSQNLQMMKDNHANHALFVDSYFEAPDPQVLVDTVLWVFRAYRSRGFHTNYWSAQLQTWYDVLARELSPATFGAIEPLYKWFIVYVPHFVSASEAFESPGAAGEQQRSQ